MTLKYRKPKYKSDSTSRHHDTCPVFRMEKDAISLIHVCFNLIYLLKIQFILLDLNFNFTLYIYFMIEYLLSKFIYSNIDNPKNQIQISNLIFG